MSFERMRFGRLRGPGLHLLKFRNMARTTWDRNGGMCFTDEKLKPGEQLSLIFLSHERDDSLQIGLTKKGTCELEESLCYFADGSERLGSWGHFLKREGQQFTIYFEKITNRVMIKETCNEPREIVFDFRPNGPVHILFNIVGKKAILEILGSSLDTIRDPTVHYEPVYLISSRSSNNLVLGPGHFPSPEESKVKLRSNLAVSHDPLPSIENSVFVRTPLRPDSALIVELTALKRRGPVRIILTVKDASRVYSSSSFSKLCETTFSFIVESGIPEPGDELAVRISPSGAVHISHNNRGWIKRAHLDADFEYNVVFDMELISVLTLVGITTGIGEVEEDQVVVPEVPKPDCQDVTLPGCIICVENSRDVVIKPCCHVAICVGCAYSLRQSDESKCPVCRTDIADVQKLYFA